MAAGQQNWLIEILLPATFNDGRPLPPDMLGRIRGDLVERFGGLTAFTRSPAEGVWVDEGAAHHDDIIVLEIMTEEVDRTWWRAWRDRMEAQLDQEEIVVRARKIERL
jgi:hypothetical protein